jgi:hypothetical protein
LQGTDLLGFADGGNLLVSANNALTVWDLDITSLYEKVCAIIGGAAAVSRPEATHDVVEACH